MGVNRRKAEREIALAIKEANEVIAGMTLGQVCASGLVVLDIACYECPCKGRYRITRLIDQHGAGKGLPAFPRNADGQLPEAQCNGLYGRCGAYFPKLVSGPVTPHF